MYTEKRVTKTTHFSSFLQLQMADARHVVVELAACHDSCLTIASFLSDNFAWKRLSAGHSDAIRLLNRYACACA